MLCVWRNKLKLSQKQLNDFDRDGFLIIPNVLSESDRAPLFKEYGELIHEVGLKRGHVNEAWESLSFEQRFTQLIANDPEAYEFLDISLPLSNDLSDLSGFHAGPAVFNLLTQPAILDIAESIVGPEVVSNPVQHTRIKPPERALNEVGRGNSNMARTGWHQDAAVVLAEAESSPILTVWVAMTDATPEMGCMRAVPGSHRWQALAKHCPGSTGKGEIYIPPPLVSDYKPVNLAVGAGGVVLLHKKTWHGAGSNQTDSIRWSFDLRYQPPGYTTGRVCFPDFLARSLKTPGAVLTDASHWSDLWHNARQDIASGKTRAVFNERWEQYSSDPMCA